MKLFQNTLGRLDYTAAKYDRLCKAIAESKYRTVTLASYLNDGGSRDGSSGYLILRHDIDRAPARALDIARIENRNGLQATYYFRSNSGTFVPPIIDEIAGLGHEIGFHYETLDKCGGRAGPACFLFRRELARFRERYRVQTVCAHGNPLTRFDNKDIWKTMQLSDCGLLGEAFLSLDFGRFAYFSDSGRTWRRDDSQKMPGKDSVKTAFDTWVARSSDDVMRIVRAGELPNICILSHPERWSADAVGFAGRWMLDFAFSWAKVAIHTYRLARP